MQCHDDVLKTRCLLDPVACNIELLWLLGSTNKELHNTQRMCTSNVEWRCHNNCKNPSGDKRKSDGMTKRRCSLQRPIQTEKETKLKIHTAQFETVQQERQDNKSGKTHGSGVALTESHETERKVNMIIGHCKPCGRNDH